MPVDPAKLDEIIEKDMKQNEEITRLITTSSEKQNTIEIEGLTLKVPGIIPRSVRHEIARVQKKGDMVDMEELEEDTYFLLSILCQNEPYNHPETWEYIDNKTGLAIDILRELLNKGFANDEKVKSFRRK